MTAILNITLPIFLLMALGYFSLRYAIFNREQIAGIGHYILRIGLPALVFHAISSRPIGDILQPVYFIGYTLASVLAFFIAYFVSIKRKLPTKLAALNGLALGMANSGFVGYPLLTMASDPQTAGVYFAMNVLTENLIIIPLMLILLDWNTQRGNILSSLHTIGRNLLRNPIVASLLIALPFSLRWLTLPTFAQKTIALLSNATAPLALFVIGASLYGLSLRGKLRDVAWVSSGKIIVMPTLVYLCLSILGASRDTLMIGTLFACAAMPSMYALFGRQHGFEQETATATLVSTLLSFIPMAIVLAWWH